MTNEPKLQRLFVTPAPHIHFGTSIRSTMFTILIALLPVIVHSIYSYGWHAVRVITLGISSAMFWELLIQWLFRRNIKIYDGTALITGLVFALILPASSPWWLVITGTFITMLIGKHIYGGNGNHPFNPVLIGWAALTLSWKDHMNFSFSMINYDMSFPVDFPLTVLRNAGTAGLSAFNINSQDIWSGKLGLFLGNQTGGLGTVAGYLILIGGIFLILRGIISWRIPLLFLAGVFLTSLIFWKSNPAANADPLFHLLTGSVLFAAFFLATDYASSPVNKTAMALFGFGCGVITVIFRVWSNYPDGVAFAILIMNILNPLLDKIRPKIPCNTTVKVKA